MSIYFRQLRLPDMGCASYLVGGDGVCAVIDPRWDAFSQYLGLARQQDLQITHIFETHVHADHVSGATRLAARTGATILLHRDAVVTYSHRSLDDGEEIVVGPVTFQVIHTPGHSLDSMSLLIRDKDGNAPPRLLSGDTLFVGDVGRPDLHGDQAATLADLLYSSLHERLLPLDDEVQVYPAHLAGSLCGRRIASDPMTTIGRERQTNSALTSEHEAFIHAILSDLPPRPPNVSKIVQLNRSDIPLKRSEITQVSPASAAALLERATVIDGRDTHTFAQGHVQGAINIPISYGQFGVMAAWLLSSETPLLLVVDDEEDLADAVNSLLAVGMVNPLSVLMGGPSEWQAAGLAVEATSSISAQELADLIATKSIGTLVDVREEGEAEKGTIAGAIVLPYRLLGTREMLPPLQEPVAVFCNSGSRSSVAASLLARAGLRVLNVLGGTTAWDEAELPLVRPTLLIESGTVG